MSSKKPPAEPKTLTPMLAQVPDEVTVTLKRHDEKFFPLRQHVGKGEINGHKVEVSYNIVSGGPIFIIGEHVYEGNVGKMTKAIFRQLVEAPIPPPPAVDYKQLEKTMRTAMSKLASAVIFLQADEKERKNWDAADFAKQCKAAADALKRAANKLDIQP